MLNSVPKLQTSRRNRVTAAAAPEPKPSDKDELDKYRNKIRNHKVSWYNSLRPGFCEVTLCCLLDSLVSLTCLIQLSLVSLSCLSLSSCLTLLSVVSLSHLTQVLATTRALRQTAPAAPVERTARGAAYKWGPTPDLQGFAAQTARLPAQILGCSGAGSKSWMLSRRTSSVPQQLLMAPQPPPKLPAGMCNSRYLGGNQHRLHKISSRATSMSTQSHTDFSTIAAVKPLVAFYKSPTMSADCKVESGIIL